MLIITDNIVNCSINNIINLDDISLEEYINKQDFLLNCIKSNISQYDIIIYYFKDITDKEIFFDKLIKGKFSTYLVGFNIESILDIKDDNQGVTYSFSENIDKNEIKDEFFDLETDYKRYLYLQKRIKYFENNKRNGLFYIVNNRLQSSKKINEDIEYIIEKCNFRISLLDCQVEIDNHKEKVNRLLSIIVNEKPKFIKTETSYIRLCLYEALELYGLKHGKVWVKRQKELRREIAKYPQFKKHKCGLRGCCNCCSDPWCCGPYCDMCYSNDYCRHAIDAGDELYPTKVTVGLEIFYERPKMNCKSFPK